MNEQDNAYGMYREHALASEAAAPVRALFLKKTYLHLLGTVAVFAGLEAAIVNMPGIQNLVGAMVATPWAWLVVLGVFMLVSGVASRMAASAHSVSTQYAGLGIYILLEAIIFSPIIWMLAKSGMVKNGAEIIGAAALVTALLFGALTFIVFWTGKDFSFLRSALYMGGFIALGLIVCAAIFGFTLGVIFSVAMVGLMCLFILYHTSDVLHHYHTDQHVVASLALFASLATLFWYVLRIAWYFYAASED